MLLRTRSIVFFEILCNNFQTMKAYKYSKQSVLWYYHMVLYQYVNITNGYNLKLNFSFCLFVF